MESFSIDRKIFFFELIPIQYQKALIFNINNNFKKNYI